MTSLARVLAGRDAPGVAEWDSTLTEDEVAQSIAVAGWRLASLDGWTAPTKPELLAALARSLDFPVHFGGNLDALVDCLREVGGDGVPVVLLWEGPQVLADGDPASYAAVVQILGDRSQVSTPAPFAVFLRR